MRLVYMGGFLVLLLAGLIGRSSTTPLSSLGKTLGQLAFWGAMILLLIGGYSYRGELRPFADRILGELDPSRPRTDDSSPPRPTRYSPRPMTASSISGPRSAACR